MSTVDGAETTQAAQRIWSGLDENQKACVRFGLLPAEVMQAEEYRHVDGQDLAVAVMQCAKQDGGMVA